MKPTAAEHRAIAARAKRIAATVRPWAPTAVSPADVIRAAIEEGWGTVARTLTEGTEGQRVCGHRPTADAWKASIQAMMAAGCLYTSGGRWVLAD